MPKVLAGHALQQVVLCLQVSFEIEEFTEVMTSALKEFNFADLSCGAEDQCLVGMGW